MSARRYALFAALALFIAFVSEDPLTAAQAFAALGVVTLLGWLATRATRVAA